MRVLKDITTPARRIPAGAEITEADLDGPLTAADWQRLGHLETPVVQIPTTEPEAPAKAPVATVKTPATPRESD